MHLPHCVTISMSIDLLATNKVSSWKTQRNAVNTCINRMWQLGLRAVCMTEHNVVKHTLCSGGNPIEEI